MSGLVGRCDESVKRTTLVNDVDLRIWRARAYAHAQMCLGRRTHCTIGFLIARPYVKEHVLSG